MTTLSIVIPAYNEENGIADIVHRVLAVREKLEESGIKLAELLVVDDGSKDRTAIIVQEIANQDDCVKLIRHTKNRGYGGALKTGFTRSESDLIGFLDADGTYPPEYFPELCELAVRGHKVVVGSRMAGADSKMPVTRRIGNLFFAGLLSVLAHQKISDSASGMRVFHQDVLESLYPLPDGLNLTPVMSARAVHEGLDMVEYPIPYSERVGRSKLSVVRDGSLFLRSMIWTVMAYNPVSVLGIIGLAGVVIALFVGLGLIITRLSGVTEIGPWGVVALFWGLVSAVIGISILALGLTFNYLVTLFNKKTVRHGLLSQGIFTQSLDRHFGWLGLGAFSIGFIVAIISLVLGLQGWEVQRIWLYLLGSAMFILVGIQLIIYWILMRVLEELSHRGDLIEKEMALGNSQPISANTRPSIVR